MTPKRAQALPQISREIDGIAELAAEKWLELRRDAPIEELVQEVSTPVFGVLVEIVGNDDARHAYLGTLFAEMFDETKRRIIQKKLAAEMVVQ